MKISPEVLDVLGNCTFEGNKLFLPGVQLERKLYEAVNKVLQANGGKWNRSAKAHIFDEPAEEAIEQALLTGEFRRLKQDLGQFDTPAAVVDRVMELADIQPGMRVLEPSAGIGRLALAAVERGGQVMCYEIDEKRCAALVQSTIAALAEKKPRLDMVVQLDFLTHAPAPNYDRVVMNPPFAKQADISHVLHALAFLKPGGRLVAVMSSSVRFRTNSKATSFRDLVDGLGAEWEDVDPGAFRESGTMVSTCILKVDV
jgi:predicted RNA methylase